MVGEYRCDHVACNILAVVTSTANIRDTLLTSGQIWEGQWVRLTVYDRGDGMYRTDLDGTWGWIGTHYRPIVNLETGEAYGSEPNE